MSDRFIFDELRNLVIGTVDFVSPTEIKVLLDINAPQNIAINRGIPSLFPKINGFVLIPNEEGALVGIISWIGIEYSQYPKRKGLKDFDLVDLPYPRRKLSISPVGILKNRGDSYKLERGIYSYPSVGDVVILPTSEQLRAIVENREGKAKIQIGTSPIAGNAPIYVDPDRLFGRHLAVLGNTGSGKSCSVAGMIRWSIEGAQKEKGKNRNINARFIILDPNGEYSKAFDDLGERVRKFKVLSGADNETGFEQLKVPIWMWNSYEWSSITRASGKTQRPLLRRALREVRNGASIIDGERSKLRLYFSSRLTSLKKFSLTVDIGNFPGKQRFAEALLALKKDLKNFICEMNDKNIVDKLSDIKKVVNDILDSHLPNEKGYYPYFEHRNAEEVVEAIESLSHDIGNLQPYTGPNEDSPVFFDQNTFVNHLAQISEDENAQQYMDWFLMRIRTILSDKRMASIIGTTGTERESYLADWLEDYIGKNNAENGEITIIDLSLVPSDVVHIVIAVIARIIFEALQWYRNQDNKILPTVLVLEEAHTFIRRYNDNNDETSPAKMCTQIFEKIAREGRKFGLGLVISSQRPSELSPTVLSQCNTFLLHRLVNDKDQELVRRLVPDSLGSLLKELPILPTRKAILLGWASPIPILVDMKELKEYQRPQSKDPDFWDVWVNNVSERSVDWEKIAAIWQERNISEDDIDCQNSNNTNQTG